MKKNRKKGWELFKTKLKPVTCKVILEKMWLCLHSLTDKHAPEYGKKYDEQEKK